MLVSIGRKQKNMTKVNREPILVASSIGKTFSLETDLVSKIKNKISGKEAPVLEALSDVSFELYRGETLGILGESGSGKSTLARVLMGIYSPESGQATLDNLDVFSSDSNVKFRVLRKMQMVFQDPFGSLDPRMTVRQILLEPLKIHGLKDFDRIESSLEEVGLGIEALDRYPSEFSGGQRQRIGICRSLMLNPEIVIADEAVSALDVSVQAQILGLLMDLKEKRNLSLIFISHDVAVVRQLADRIILLFKGRIVEELPSDCLLKDASHPYTKSLLNSALYLREGGELVDPVVKDNVKLGTACPYFAFCSDSFEKCSKAPAFFPLHEGHRVACWKYEKQ